jgi:hemolysin activation/secretion protein
LCGAVTIVLLIGPLLDPSPIHAASPTEVGSEDERLRRDLRLEVPERPTIPIELPPEGELPPVPDATPIEVRRVELEGATLLPRAQADRLTQSVVGKTVTLQQLREVAQAITRWYRGRGYVTSRAVVPAQSVDEGVVRVRVVEGRVGAVRVEGRRYSDARRLERALRAKPGEVLWLPALEAGLVTLNSHPDRSVRLVLAPGAEPGTTDLVLQVRDRLPVHAAYTVDTLGSNMTGRIRHSVSLMHRNLSGRDDRLAAMGLLTEFGGLQGGSVSYLIPVTDRGAALSLDVSGVRSSVGEQLKSLKAHGHALTISPGVQVPLILRQRLSLEAQAGLEYRRIRTFLDEVANSKDDLRVVRLGSSLFAQDRWGRNALAPELRIGIPNVMGGMHPEDTAASRAAAGGDFVRLLTQIARVQRAPWNTSVLFRGLGQITSDRLVPAEQLRLGGADTVRGYPEGDYLADTGYQMTLEYRVPVGSYVPAPANEAAWIAQARRSVTLVGFWDYAEGFIRHPRGGEDADMRLAGVGLGVHARPSPESLVQIDVGWPIGDDASEDGRLRVHLVARLGF